MFWLMVKLFSTRDGQIFKQRQYYPEFNLLRLLKYPIFRKRFQIIYFYLKP